MTKQHLFYVLFLLPFLGIGQDWDEIVKIVASDRGAVDNFGYSVAISGDYAVVGAYGESEGVDDQSTINNSGAVYIFKKDNSGVWSQQQKVVASDRGDTDRFGHSVGISGDYIVVGARYDDKDAFGDNDNVVINAGSAYIFKREGDVWSQQQKIVASDRVEGGHFGMSAAISGDYIVVGAPAAQDETGTFTGASYIFKREGEHWAEQHKIVASDGAGSDNFGWNVDIDGEYVVVGSFNNGTDAQGGNVLNNAGSAYVFKRENNSWLQQQKIIASDRGEGDEFGFSVAVSGNYIVVGARHEDEDINGGNTITNSGSAYIFTRDGNTWLQQQKVIASDRERLDRFGSSIAISGNYIVVGASYEDHDVNGENNMSASGSAYIFKREGNIWSEQQKIVASDRAAGDYFSESVAIDGNLIILGAPYEDEDVNGENTLTSSGSAYLFGLCDIAVPQLEGTTEVCFGEEVTITAVVNEGNTVNWYDSEEGDIPISTGTELILYELTETKTYWVEALTAFWCVSERVAFTVTVNPLPELTVLTSSAETCEGSATTLEAAVVVAEDLIFWYDSPDATEWIGTGTEFITPELTETTSFWVQSYNPATYCVSERIEIVVTVIPVPILNLETPEPSVCYGNEAELFATSPSNVIFWYVNQEDEEYLYHGNLFITEYLTETTTYWVEAYSIITGCASERIEVTVTVNPIPDAPTAVTVQTFEEGATLADLEVEAEGDLTWYANEELTIVLPETTPLIAYMTYYVTQIIGGCQSEAIGILVEPELEISDVNGKEFMVYPNPTNGVVKIQSKTTVANITVFNINGQIVTSVKATNEVDLSGYPSGTYVIRITLENGNVVTKKAIKK